MRAKFITALAVNVLLANAAFADDFINCDAYPAPTKKADGVTSTNLFFGLAVNIDVRKSNTQQFGTQGIASCDAALASPLLVPAHSLRRANLLQAKALHQVAAGQHEAALATLQQSDDIGAAMNDRWLNDSVLVGNRAIRVYTLNAMQRYADAEAERAKLAAARPYSAQLAVLTARLGLASDQSLTHYSRELAKTAPVNPNVHLMLYWANFGDRQFERAIEFAPHVYFDVPKTRGNWEIDGADEARYELVVLRASVAGALAYAQAATGNTETANTTLAEASNAVLATMEPPPPPAQGKKLNPEVVTDFETRKLKGARAQRELAKWRTAIDLRRAAPTLAKEELFDKARAQEGLRDLGILPDLLMQLTNLSPADAEARDKFIVKWREDFSRSIVSDSILTPKTLFDLLPRPEKEAMVPRFRKAGGGVWLSDNGFSHETDADSVMVRFTHSYASRAMVEELALLRAALLAKEAGRDSLVLLTRMAIERTTRTSYGYGNYKETPSGMEATLRVKFVDSRALPAPYQAATARVFAVQQVIDDLTTKYASLFKTPDSSTTAVR
jgi:hypothetical protein